MLSKFINVLTAFGRVIGLYRRLQNQIISQIINKDIRLNHRLFETIAFKNVTVILRLGGKRHLIRHKRNCDAIHGNYTRGQWRTSIWPLPEQYASNVAYRTSWPKKLFGRVADVGLFIARRISGRLKACQTWR